MLEKLRTSPLVARALLAVLRRRPEFIHPRVALRLSRDLDDDKLLECAVTGQGKCVVSANADLLMLRAVQGIPILDVPAFRKKLEETER